MDSGPPGECQTHLVRDNRFRHLRQIPSQDGRDIMRRVLRVLPIQVFPVLHAQAGGRSKGELEGQGEEEG